MTRHPYAERLERCSGLMEAANLDALILTIAHYFEHFGIREGVVGLEYTFLTQSMMGMLTHPHAKPEGVTVKDCTHITSELRIVKDKEEIKRIQVAAKVADKGMKAAIAAVKPGVTES